MKNNINFKKVSKTIDELVEEVGLLDSFPKWGKNNPRVADRQFLYGDIMDWLRDVQDVYPLNQQERHFVAVHLIGEYVTKNTLL